MVTPFLFEYPVAYCVVAKESVPKNVSVAFLERLKDDFMKRYGGGKADTALAKSLNKEYGYVWLISTSENFNRMFYPYGFIL